MMEDFKYFSPVQGHVVPRYGKGGRSYIGCAFDSEKKAFVFDTAQVIAIPITEYIKNKKAYDRAIKNGALTAKTKADHDNHIKALESPAKSDTEAPKKTAKKSGKKEV